MLCVCASSAQAQPAGRDEAEQRRFIDRQAEQERRLQPSPNAALPRPEPAPIGALPLGETPCFLIERVSLEDDTAARFPWVLDVVDSGGNTALSPIGKCLGALGVAALIKRTQDALVNRGYVTSVVAALPQDLSLGVLQLTVLPGRVRRVAFAPPFNARATAINAVPVRAGDVLNLRDVEQALENFKRVPTAQANIDIVPVPTDADSDRTEIKGPGVSDLVVTWKQGNPFRWNLSLDDSGNKATGKYQGSLSLSYDHALTLNDLLYITLNQGLGGGDPGRRGTRSTAFHYSLPMGYWLLGFNASHNRYFQNVAGAWQDYLYSGTSSNQDIRLSRLVQRDKTSKTTQHLKAFARQSNNFIDDTEVEIQRRRVGGWELGVGHRAQINQTSFDFALAYRRGTGAFGSMAAPEELFGEGTSRFALFSLDAGLQHPFQLAGQKLRYSTSLKAQANRTPLTPQDRFAIGGRYTVRGFDGESSLSAERGWLIRNELAATLGGSEHEVFLGLDRGAVHGPSTQWLIGNRLTGAVIGLRGAWKGTQYELFAGIPIRQPEGFRTAHAALGFQMNWAL